MVTEYIISRHPCQGTATLVLKGEHAHALPPSDWTEIPTRENKEEQGKEGQWVGSGFLNQGIQLNKLLPLSLF